MKTLRADFDDSHQAVDALSDIKKLNIKIKSAAIQLQENFAEEITDYNLIGLGILNTPASVPSRYGGAPAGVVASTILVGENKHIPANLSILTKDSYVHQLIPILEEHGMTDYTLS